jgi:hypothetical protein
MTIIASDAPVSENPTACTADMRSVQRKLL